MKIAAIQLECSTNFSDNVEKCKSFINIASDYAPDLICFPELAFYHWFPSLIDPYYLSFATPIISPLINDFQNIAKEKQVVLLLPFFEKDIASGVYYNSATIIDKNGEIKGLYRKVHIPLIPNWEEKYYFKPGNLGFPVIDTSIGKIGIQLGWDVFFPEAARILTLKGADIIVSPTCSALSSQSRWLKVLTTSALINTVFICRINRVGKQGELEFYGGSFSVFPDGTLVSEPAGESESVVLWDINFNETSEARRVFPFLRDRREKEYTDIVGIPFESIIKERQSYD